MINGLKVESMSIIDEFKGYMLFYWWFVERPEI